MLIPRAYRAFLLTIVFILFPAVCLPQEEPQFTPDQQREFLLNAKILRGRQLSVGITNSHRLTLSDGKIEHDAHYQSVNERRSWKDSPRGGEMNFVDSYLYNIAAYELAKLIGLDHMLPVTVERKWKGRAGSLAWWLSAQMDEGERTRRKIRPPDILAWNMAMYKVRVFTELIYDTDRSNPGNMLIGHDWEIYMIDFSRAFRLYHDLRTPENLVWCCRKLLKKLRVLDAEEVEAKLGKYLNELELEGIMKRRDKIVDYFDTLIAEKGENAVLY